MRARQSFAMVSIALAGAGAFSCAAPDRAAEDPDESAPSRSDAVSLPKVKLPKWKLPKIELPKLPTATGFSEQAWGEAGRWAYPAAGVIMQQRNGNRPEEAIPRHERAVLRKYYGGLVDRVVVSWGADPVEKWDFGTYVIRFSRKESRGQTYGHRIYIRDAKEDMTSGQRLALLAHELVHAEQYERFGSSMGEFGYQYFREYKRAGQSYRNNKLEAEAYSRVEENERFLQDLVNDYDAETHPPSFCLVDVEGTLTINNPTRSALVYEFHWDPIFPWTTITLQPNTAFIHFISDGCGADRAPEMRLDSSFEEGSQPVIYTLDYEDVPMPVDPARRERGTEFYFDVTGSDIDLYRR